MRAMSRSTRSRCAAQPHLAQVGEPAVRVPRPWGPHAAAPMLNSLLDALGASNATFCTPRRRRVASAPARPFPYAFASMSLTSQVLRVHEALYKRSDGRVGHRMLGVPTLLLRTTGRRSGATRTNGLVYARDGDDYLVVASNGGADRPPAWLHNVSANPRVEIQIGRQRRGATARVISPPEPDYERLWKIVNENNRDRYSGYQRLTTRPIPVVAITPS
jgi:deazaflavin-dependent oxidoreductase (nitroreductase family)